MTSARRPRFALHQEIASGHRESAGARETARTAGSSDRSGRGRRERLRQWARTVRRDVLALWLAMRDPRVPWYAKALAALVAGYALSPIDLIPDVIPVLGYLDDLVLLPVGIVVVVRLIPPAVMEDLRRQAATRLAGRRPTSTAAAIVIVAIWLSLAVGTAILVANAWSAP